MAAKKKGGLGRGLGALINVEEEPIKEEVKQEPVKEPVIIQNNGPLMVDIYQVEPDREQPRQDFEEEALEELAVSIKEHGILQPILVNQQEGYYRIIAGERRWRAAKLAGLSEVPILVKELTEEEAFELSLIENIQREDLNPIEEALAYRRLIEEYKLTQDRISKKVGKSRSAIANALRLLNLADGVIAMLENGQISTGHAKVLLGVEDKERQLQLAQRVESEDLSVRQLENVLKMVDRTPVEKEELPAAYRNVQNRMQDLLQTKVTISKGKRKGKIEIEYYSEEDLERLMLLFGSIQEKE